MSRATGKEPSYASAAARLGLASVAGGVIGYFAETIHRAAGVWRLPDGASLPLWIAPVYAAALFAAGSGLRLLERRVQTLRVSARRGAVEAALFVALFLAPPLLHTREHLLAVLAIVYLAARLASFRARGDLLVVCAVIVLDLAVESSLIAASLFRYTHASLGPLPLWLAPLWGGLGLGLRRLFAMLAERPAR